jgi:Tol biopolymer transport system component
LRSPRLVIGGMVIAVVAGCGADTRVPTPSSGESESASAAATASVSAGPSAPASAGLTAEARVLAPDVISTDAEEYRISFSPDGSTASFARGDGFFPQTQRATIVESRLVDDAWSEATVVGFSGEHPDIDPWVSPDGDSLFFSSIRPVDGATRRDADLWRVHREGDAWGEPIHLGAVNSDANELGGSVSADGVLWFASDRAGAWDLYAAQPTADGYAEPEPVEALNTPLWEFNPAISADGSTLLFTSIGRDGGSGLGDLFVSSLVEGEWSEPQPLLVNTSADEYHASWSTDGSTLYFVRRAGDGDIHEVPWAEADPGG